MKKHLFGILVCLLLAPMTAFAQNFCGYLEEDTAPSIKIDLLEDDGLTARTTGTTTASEILISKNGAALAAKNEATALAHDAGGGWTLLFDATDTSTPGLLYAQFKEAGFLPFRCTWQILDPAAYACAVTGACGPTSAITDVIADLDAKIGVPSGGTLVADTAEVLAAVQAFETIPKNTDFLNWHLWFLDANGNGVTGITTAGIVCKISKDGAAAATTADTTEVEVDAVNQPGLYVVDLAAAELNGNSIALYCTGTGARPIRVNIQTQR